MLAQDNIPDQLHEDARRYCTRFLAACDAVGVTVVPDNEKLLIAVFAVSSFIAETAIAAPGWFAEEILAAPVAARYRDDYKVELTAALADVDDDDTAYTRIRQIRNRTLCRIAWRDIVAGAAVESVIAELSDFADACISAGLVWVARTGEARYGTPRDGNNAVVSLLVLGMGKLGGRELNFSSDIDLIFAYPTGGTTLGGRREISNQEYFDKLGRRFIALLSDQTAAGFAFRVDMRLRPFGDSGPLTSNFDALEHYYQLHGRDWERYAFIKARIITGDDGAVQRLQQILKPFVYRRYLDYGALEAVREMKALINAEVARKDLIDDVKLGAGGIREIEFIGQTFQLIRGGREPRLQERSILRVLNVCAALNLLDLADADALADAYRFLRRTEHRLQQVADRQTHRLPQDPKERARLGFAMGYADYATFELELNRHRALVGRCFQELLRPEDEAEAQPHGARSDVQEAADYWAAEAPDVRVLLHLGFEDPDATATVIAQLKAPRFLDRLSREGRERLNRLMPHLIASAGRRAQRTETFARLADLIRAIARRSVYLSLLADHPQTLERLIDLYHASPWIARQITQQPLLLDELLDPRVLYAPPEAQALVTQLGTLLAQYPHDDVERLMETLRHFRNQQVLRVAASDIMGQFPVADVSNQLSYIAQALLHHALGIAMHVLSEKHGEPTCIDQGRRRPVGFAIVAYGKLGGLELGYGSDLDLVFVHDGRGSAQVTDGGRSIDNTVFFTRLTQRIIHYLSTRTPSGRAYEIDTRLRPSGEAGLLVSSVDAFAAYQQTDAWTWEHQALIRARAVAGDPATMQDFERIRSETLAQPRDPARLRTDILDMRARMRGELDRSDAVYFDLKQGLGGITDIEFMVQYAVLRWAHAHHELLVYSDNLRLLEVLTDLGLIAPSFGSTLHDAYFAYRAEVHRCALNEVDGLVDDTKFRDYRAAVVEAWQTFFESVG